MIQLMSYPVCVSNPLKAAQRSADSSQSSTPFSNQNGGNLRVNTYLVSETYQDHPIISANVFSKDNSDSQSRHHYNFRFNEDKRPFFPDINEDEILLSDLRRIVSEFLNLQWGESQFQCVDPAD
jgi:hypothetical protein